MTIPMPEGDTIYRAAAMMNRALAGAAVRRFESPLPLLERFVDNHGLVGRTIERVEARGKYLLVHFGGGLTLLTHQRMNGSWHLYRPGERWRRPRSAMRARIVTDRWEAVGFGLPIAELHDAGSLARSPRLQALGPDPLTADFDPEEAVRRLRAAGDLPIEEALLDQRRLTGIGNVLKSEALFLAHTHPYARVSALDDDALGEIVGVSQRLLRENVLNVDRPSIARAAARSTTRSSDPAARLFVYGRAGKPCRRCGASIQYRRSGRDARSSYWCPRCQSLGAGTPAPTET
jgi:endonuclease-8